MVDERNLGDHSGGYGGQKVHWGKKAIGTSLKYFWHKLTWWTKSSLKHQITNKNFIQMMLTKNQSTITTEPTIYSFHYQNNIQFAY